MNNRSFSIRLLLIGAFAVTAVWSGATSVLAQSPKAVPFKQVQEKEDEKEEAGKKPGPPKSARWQVSFSVDPDSQKMSRRPVNTTIAHLVAFKRPAVLPKKGSAPPAYKAKRIAPVETTIWKFKGTVVSVAAEHDGDYRLIVSDAKGRLVCCVMPDPSLGTKKGKFTAEINQARAVVVKRFKPTFDARTVKVPVEITGLGYFGRMNSDANPSPEGLQIRAIKVRFPGGKS